MIAQEIYLCRRERPGSGGCLPALGPVNALAGPRR